MLRRATAALALVSLVVLAGCSGGSRDSAGAPGSQGSATAGSAADTLITTGLEQLANDDDEAARTTFENVLDLDPGNAYAHYNLGLIAQGAGQEARAREQYESALATDPELAPALYNLGILRESDDLDASVDLYRRAVASDPDLAPAHMRLGFALLHLGETEEAEDALARGIAIDPSLRDVEAPTYE